MASNLGSMVLEMSANTARFQSDMGKIVQSASEAADKIVSRFEKVGAAIGVGLGAHEFKEWISGAIEAQDQALKLSQKIGVAVDSIAGLSSAALKADIDQQTFQASMVKLAKSASEAAGGVAASAVAYKAMGVNVKDANGNIKSSDVLLGELSDKFAGYKDGIEKTNLAITLFGKAGANMIPLLNGGSEAIKRQIQLAKDLGVAVGTEAAKGAEEFNDKLKDLGLVSKGVSNQIASALLPALNELADASLKFFTSDAWKVWLDKISAGFKTAADYVSGFAKVVSENFGVIVAAVTALAELKIAQWAVAAGASLLALGQKVVIGATLWAEMTGGVAAAQVAMGALAATSEALLATIGGIPGVIALVAVGLYQLATYQDGAAKASASLRDAQIALANTTGESVDADLRMAAAAQSAAKAEIAQAQAILTTLEVQNQANASIKFGATQTDIAALAYSANASRIDTLREHISAATKQLNDLAHATTDATSQSQRFGSIIVSVGTSFKAGDIGGNSAKFVAASNAIHTAADQMIKDGANATIVRAEEDNALARLSASLRAFGDANKAAAPNVAGLTDKNNALTKSIVEQAQAMDDLQKLVTTLEGKANDQFGQAFANYTNQLLSLKDAAEKAAIAGGNVDTIIHLWQQGEEAAAAALAKTNAQLTAQSDLLGKFERDMAEQSALVGLSDRELAVAQAVRKVTDEYQANIDAGKKVSQSLDELQRGAATAAGNFYDLKKSADLTAEAARAWQGIWTSAANGVADTFAKVLVTGGSMFNGLKDLAKQTVEQIIAYFAKLAVINPILNGIFGGQSGWTQLAQFGGSVIGGGGSSGFNELGSGTSVIGQALSSGGTGGSSSFSLFSPSSWIDAGKNLASGFSTLWSGNAPLMDANGVLQYQPNSGASIANGGYSSGFGQALGVAGAAYAGYNRYQQAGGGVGGVIGGATYAAGTYALGAGLSSAVAGTGFAAGVSGAFAAIPVVGWIALAAMIVDKFSGGKLFGTKGKVVGGNQTTNVADDGTFDIDTTYTTKGQKALFGGAYWKEHSTPTDPAAIKSAQDFVDALKKGTEDFAKSLGADFTGIVGGKFNTSYDKNGKETGTESTVLGVTRKGETQAQFAERLQADSFLKVLDSMGLGASAFVAGLQDDADKLFAGVQDFAQAATLANTDLGNGFHFLALSSDATLKDVMKFVEGMQAGGEALSQTYARLAQAQQQYNQFTGQFKPTTAYVDDFEAGMSQLYHTMLQNIDTANALAIAAGATGAAQEDLTNIQSTAARQMAQLTMQLENSAQSLAFSLGLTTQGSLDQVNQAITDIINSAKGADAVTSATTEATQATRTFGNTIGAVAKQTNDAINLLLGNLSPLNDQQKLQVALQGLRAGTTSQSDVLEIGRRLYASSQAYTDLFNQVQQYGPKGGGGGSYRGTVTVLEGSYKAGTTAADKAKAAATPDNWTGTDAQWKATGLTAEKWAALSEADQKKLEDLLNKQATLQQSKSLSDFSTLSQQIAEIASAKGEDWKAVIAEMGVNAKDLEAGLGLKTDEELSKYFASLASQQDSAKENTASIVDAISLLPQRIADAIGGKGGNPGISLRPSLTPAPATTPSAPPIDTGTRTGGGTAPPPGGRPRNLTDGDVQAIGAEFTRSLRLTGDAIASTYQRPSARIAVR